MHFIRIWPSETIGILDDICESMTCGEFTASTHYTTKLTVIPLSPFL